MKRFVFLLLLPTCLLAQDAPQLTEARLFQMLGEAQARIALQGDYIQILQKKIIELQAELEKYKPKP